MGEKLHNLITAMDKSLSCRYPAYGFPDTNKPLEFMFSLVEPLGMVNYTAPREYDYD